MPVESPEKFIEALEQIRVKCDQPYVSTADWDRLIGLLQMAFCPHQFFTRRAGGAPDDPGSLEAVEVCDKCGMER